MLDIFFSFFFIFLLISRKPSEIEEISDQGRKRYLFTLSNFHNIWLPDSVFGKVISFKCLIPKI